MATLGFSTKWPKHMGGGETNFIPKIYNGLIGTGLGDFKDYDDFDFLACQKGLGQYFPNFRKVQHFNPKLHTMREDKKDLWKPGRKIHMVVFNRTKNRFQFAPILEVKSVQKIEIKEMLMVSAETRYITNDGRIMYIEIDGRPLLNHEYHTFSKNDGFDSAEHFFQWFNKNQTLKIIHWTNLKY